MFEVKVSIKVRLEGCPESGLGAVDFRRLHQLPEAPTAEVLLEWNGVSEALCRAFPELVDDKAELSVTVASSVYSRYELCEWRAKEAFGSDWDQKSLFASLVPVATARMFLVSDGCDMVTAVSLLFTQLKEQAAAGRARKAETLAARTEEERVRREQAAAEAYRQKIEQAAKLDDLADWAKNFGSELAQLRMNEGLASWVATAQADFVTATLAAVVEQYPSGDVPDGYELDEANQRTHPTVPELVALRKLRAQLTGQPCTVALMWMKYRPEEGDGYVDSLEPFCRAELRVTVTCPDGHTETHDFLIPDPPPADAA